METKVPTALRYFAFRSLAPGEPFRKWLIRQSQLRARRVAWRFGH